MSLAARETGNAMKKIAITGANGQLGSALCARFGDQAIPLTRSELDLANLSEIQEVLTKIQPDIVINCAAYTAVDKAEEDTELSERINGDAVGEIAKACNTLDITLVQISTDYVFEASESTGSPWKETDQTKAKGKYATSKLLGEANAQNAKRHFVIRTCGLYDAANNGPVRGRNFVDTMLSLSQDRDQLSIVNDQRCTPTYIPHLADAIEFLADRDEYGIYHITNGDEATWFEFAGELFRQSNTPMSLEPITTEQYGAPAPRPGYSVLDNAKYLALGGPKLPSWTQGLSDYLSALSIASS